MNNWTAIGITLPNGKVTGQFNCRCPKCSDSRKPENKDIKCLSANLDTGAFKCHNCDWSGYANNIDNSYSTSLVTTKPIEMKMGIPDEAKVLRTLNDSTHPFIEALIIVLLRSGKSKTEIREYLRECGVGTNGTHLVYVLRDKEGIVRNLKYFTYTGLSRSKNFPPFHEKSIQGEKYLVPLFLSHLLVPEKITCVVESEKEAIAGRLVYPQYNWISTGGTKGLTDANINTLFGYKVYFICQADEAGRDETGKLNTIFTKLKVYNIDFVKIDLFPERNDGYDLFDSIRDGVMPEIKPCEELTLTEPQKVLIDKVKVFDPYKEIQRPVPFLSIESGMISTSGYITVIAGMEKAGKSGLICATVAGAILFHEGYIDFDLIKVQPNISHKAVLHYDLEQSEYNHYKSNMDILRRLKSSNIPSFYKSFLLRGLSIKERIEFLDLSTEIAFKEHNGIHCIFLDGGADFVNSTNDEEESLKIVLHLEQLAMKYNCPVIVVIHLNPGSMTKGRGHLDSQLRRKCESYLTVTKDRETEISTIEFTLLRNAGGIPKMDFRYDTEKGYHVSIGASNKLGQKEKEFRENYEGIFNYGLSTLTYSKLVEEVCRIEGVEKRTAKSRISTMIKTLKMIEYIDDKKTALKLIKHA